MRNALIWGLVTALGLSAGPVFGAPGGSVLGTAVRARPGVVLVGLELRSAQPPEPRKPAETLAPAAGPKPTPAPAEAKPTDAASARDPVDAAVDVAMGQQREAAGAPLDGAEMAALGAPVSGPARHAIEEIARTAGIKAGQLASVADTPRDQAYFLAEQLFDPNVGASVVRTRYGLPGELAAESYRRMRDVFQVLDMSAAQRQSVTAVIERALVAGNALGQVDNPDYEMIDVDPGPRADLGRFERAVAAHRAIARCMRPPERTGGHFYMVEIPRHGPWMGGAICHDAWTSPVIAAAPTERLPGAVTDSGDAGLPVASDGGSAAGAEPSAGSIEAAPRPPAGAPESAPLPNDVPTNDASAWRYVVTSGPQGPVVTRVPEQMPR